MSVASAVTAGLLISTAGLAGAQGSWQDEPVPPRPETNSVLESVDYGSGAVWAFGSWHPVPGSPDFRSQAYQRGPDGWTEVAMPDIGQIAGSSVVSGEDAWAVGQKIKYGEGQSARWDGTQWHEVEFAAAPADHRLHVSDINATQSDAAWAVGGYAPNGEGQATGMAQFWDGASWSDAPLPEVEGSWSLDAVDGTDENSAWAVGTQSGAGGQGVALRWNGQDWQRQSLPEIEVPSGSWLELDSVVGLTTGEAWIGGSVRSYEDGQPVKPVLLRSDGTSWEHVSAPTRTGGIEELSWVDRQLWVIGDSVWRSTDGGWQDVGAPANGALSSATVQPGGGLLAVGRSGSLPQYSPLISVYRD
ncbi:WD40/YVTN/BNR-like repeat-containing protein [Tamaricihabitans halophyticus]|uniref:WD40/YVTN/BNR-like repeat-containing protein n=1 Tax=Tamaricihabitans halophyticus TaxID=1262583 RepID=UPI00104372F0|nr:hypothetical protein [Tamaricihabitans halophyticus]